MIPTILALSFTQFETAAFERDLAAALASKNKTAITAFFRRPEDAEALFGNIDLDKAKVSVGMAPRGWDGLWAVVHCKQEIQAQHDMVYTLAKVGNAWKLGREIEEWRPGRETKVEKMTAAVALQPNANRANVAIELELDKVPKRGTFFRLTNQAVVPDGKLRRLGSLLIWDEPEKKLQLKYDLTIPETQNDQIQPTHAYLSAFWIPQISRLPMWTDVTVRGPEKWEIRSEGDPKPLEEHWALKNVPAVKDSKTVRFAMPYPISFPKVVAGEYTLAAELKQNGKTFKAWHFAPVDKERAEFDVKRMAEFAKFCEDKMAPWPFPGYECFDSKGYYGIESYSYTLLDKSISSRYVAHEMGHTYFGGMVPCAYIEDTWNEGLTTYLDDVLTGRFIDRPLEQGQRTASIPVALSKMGVAWAHSNASYSRGGLVAKMLEHEIGQDNLLKALARMTKEEQGKNTTWASLRPYFEKESGKKLDWFWAQWVDSGTFPELKIDSARYIDGKTTVSYSQTGTPKPYRLRFNLIFKGDGKTAKQELLLDGSQEQMEFEDFGFRPTSVALDTTGLAIVHRKTEDFPIR